MNADEARAMANIGQGLIDKAGIQVGDDWKVGTDGTTLMLRFFQDGHETVRWYGDLKDILAKPTEAADSLKAQFAPRILH